MMGDGCLGAVGWLEGSFQPTSATWDGVLGGKGKVRYILEGLRATHWTVGFVQRP